MGYYTPEQKLYLCCGYFCSLMACIGVYFWLVLFYMQADNSPYIIYEMTKQETMDNTQVNDTFKWSFLLTSIVRYSTLSNNTIVAECVLLSGMRLLRYFNQRDPRRGGG